MLVKAKYQTLLIVFYEGLLSNEPLSRYFRIYFSEVLFEKETYKMFHVLLKLFLLRTETNKNIKKYYFN